MSDMEHKEIVERYVDSLRMASCRAKELAKSQKKVIWNQIAVSLDGLAIKGHKLAHAKAKSEMQILAEVERYQKGLN